MLPVFIFCEWKVEFFIIGMQISKETGCSCSSLVLCITWDMQIASFWWWVGPQEISTTFYIPAEISLFYTMRLVSSKSCYYSNMMDYADTALYYLYFTCCLPHVIFFVPLLMIFSGVLPLISSYCKLHLMKRTPDYSCATFKFPLRSVYFVKNVRQDYLGAIFVSCWNILLGKT